MHTRSESMATQDITQVLIDRYLQQQSEIQAHASETLNAARAAALQLLQSTPLPRTWSENYKRFDLDALLSRPFVLNTTRQSYGVDPLKEHPCHLAYMSAVQSFVLDDRVYATAESTMDDYFIGPISLFEARFPNIAEAYYNKMQGVVSDPLSALNTLFAQDALVIYIPKGVQLNEPLHVINLSGIAPDVLASPRYLIIAEANASATLLFCDHAHSDRQSLRNSVIEIYADTGAHIEYYDVEESSTSTARIHNLHVHQEATSSVVVSNLTITNGLTRNNYFADLVDERASFDLSGLAILDGDQRADNWSLIRHSAPNCHSNELFKYSLNDRSVGSFTGRIYVARDAQKTESYQTNRNLLLAPTAKMYSKPQLEIYADDVKCSHGMTTGQIDTQALFYMMQRGIPEMEARLMLTIAFMGDVLETIRMAPLKERLADVIDKRFRGVPASCGSNCTCHH